MTDEQIIQILKRELAPALGCTEPVAIAYAAAGAPGEIGTFMGNIAGALATNIIGNKESVEKVNVLKYAGTLLNV